MNMDIPPKLWLPPAIIRPAPVQKANFLPGMFPGLMIAAGADEPAVPASLSFLQVTPDTANQTTYNFASQGLGDADATRRIVVSVLWYTSSAAQTLNSASIASESATIHVQRSRQISGNNYVGSAIISSAVPTGTSGTISVTFSAGCLGCAIGVYRAINLNSATPHDTDFGDPGPISLSLDIPENGIFVSCCMYLGDAAVTTSGMTEDFNAAMESSVRYIGGSGTGLSQETGRALDFTGGSFAAVAVAASWG